MLSSTLTAVFHRSLFTRQITPQQTNYTDFSHDSFLLSNLVRSCCPATFTVLTDLAVFRGVMSHVALPTESDRTPFPQALKWINWAVGTRTQRRNILTREGCLSHPSSLPTRPIMSDRDTVLDDSALACPIPSHLRCTGVGKSRRWMVRLSGDAPYSELS
jgi:hypothetical protein